LDIYDSFAIRSKVLRAMQLSNDSYNLEGVPTIIINGRYCAIATSGNSAHYLDVVDALIGKARAEQKKR
jgi:hypothetical protein